jgi:hypothetical protein
MRYRLRVIKIIAFRSRRSLLRLPQRFSGHWKSFISVAWRPISSLFCGFVPDMTSSAWSFCAIWYNADVDIIKSINIRPIDSLIRPYTGYFPSSIYCWHDVRLSPVRSLYSAKFQISCIKFAYQLSRLIYSAHLVTKVGRFCGLVYKVVHESEWFCTRQRSLLSDDLFTGSSSFDVPHSGLSSPQILAGSYALNVHSQLIKKQESWSYLLCKSLNCFQINSHSTSVCLLSKNYLKLYMQKGIVCLF